MVKLTSACAPTPPPHNYSRVRKQTDRTAESERACEWERECGQADVSLAESKRVYERSVSVVARMRDRILSEHEGMSALDEKPTGLTSARRYCILWNNVL